MKAKKTNLQKVIEPQRGDSHSTEEVKRYLGALSEDYHGQVKAIAEQFQGLHDKIDEVKGTLDEHGRILDSHTEMIGILMEDVAVVKEDIVVIKEDIVVIKEDIVVMKEDISIIKNDVKKKVDYDEFAALAKRVSLIETKIRR